MNDVVVFDKEGERMRSCINIKDPYCVAVDDADNIYITHNENKLVKLNKYLHQIKYYIEQDSLLRGVSVFKDQVVVCDSKNMRILVFTKELKYMKDIKDPVHFKDICDISQDKHGNLYVCDYGYSRIHVLSIYGQYLRSFVCDGNESSGPWDIYVASQYVYATNRDNHTISVYTAEGEHVTTFGKEGNDVINPWGVCVDKDGFVYICDYSNDRVQVF